MDWRERSAYLDGQVVGRTHFYQRTDQSIVIFFFLTICKLQVGLSLYNKLYGTVNPRLRCFLPDFPFWTNFCLLRSTQPIHAPFTAIYLDQQCIYTLVL